MEHLAFYYFGESVIFSLSNDVYYTERIVRNAKHNNTQHYNKFLLVGLEYILEMEEATN